MELFEARAYIKAIANNDPDGLEMAICEWANCLVADIDDGSGDIYISSPKHGHWLDDDRLIEFVEWLEAQAEGIRP